MFASIPDLFDYRVLIIAGLRDDGYAASAACHLANRFKDKITVGYTTGAPVADIVREIVEQDDNAMDTPVLTDAEKNAAALDAVERVMEEGR